MTKLKTIWHIVGKYKYWATLGAFILIIGILDENNLIRRFTHQREISRLKSEIERYRKKYEEDSKTLKEITTNREELEKVAREKYFMKKENEDIFIFEEDLK